MEKKYSPYWINFIYYFNVARDFYACHEHGEFLWLNSGRPDCLKGLIQIAVSFYHLSRGNEKGAQIMRSRGIGYIRPSAPAWEGVDLERLIADTEHFFTAVQGSVPLQTQDVALLAPRLHLTDPELERVLGGWHPIPLEDEKDRFE